MIDRKLQKTICWWCNEQRIRSI